MKHILKAGAIALTTLSGGAVAADPAFGIGLTYVLGGDFALGFRVFSDNKQKRGALALGVEYKFSSQSFRPTVGAAYLDKNAYVDLSLGYDINVGAVDFGIGLGGLGNMQKNTTNTTGPVVVSDPGVTGPTDTAF